MHKFSLGIIGRHRSPISFLIAFPHTEELRKVEVVIIRTDVTVARKDFTKVVGVDIEFGKSFVWVFLTRMLLIPFLLCLLLHHVIPCADFVFFLREVIEYVERSARKIKEFRGAVFAKPLDYVLAEGCLRTFVRLVKDDEVPIGLEDFIVLVNALF